jgi:hypothetical protein
MSRAVTVEVVLDRGRRGMRADGGGGEHERQDC